MTDKDDLTRTLKILLDNRREDPDIPAPDDQAFSDFLGNPDNSDRIRMRKREKRIRQIQKHLGIDPE